MSNCDVILVGYGPTAAILANLLGSYGWRVDVFERAPAVYDLPRAVHFDGEVMRIFQRLGLAKEIEAATQPVCGMDLLGTGGTLLARYVAPTSPGPLGWHEGYMFHQPELERTLRNGVDRYPNVHVHLGTEIDSIRMDENGAAVRGASASGAVTSAAKFVVGCCGARSITRHAIQAESTDLGADKAWVVVDVKLLRNPGLPGVTVQYCEPERPATYVPSSGNLRRFELMLLPGEVASEMLAPDRIQSILSRWLQPADYVTERAAVYTFHATVANQWRADSIFLAGDAAHQMPPFLGQGLGSGARDAANLAWKLDLVLRGVANASLLDTYQAERMPHVRTLIESDLWLSSIIQTTDPDLAQQRDLQMTAAPSGGVLVPPNPPLGGGLCDDGAASRRPSIQPLMDNGVLHDSLLGDGFTLLGATQPSDWAARVLQALGTRFLPDPAPALVEWLSSLGTASVLIRPDRYVLAHIHDTDDLDRALRPLAEHLVLDAFTH